LETAVSTPVVMGTPIRADVERQPAQLAAAHPLGEALAKRRATDTYTMPRMYYEAFGQMKKQLGQLDKWLDQAAGFAREKAFEPNDVLGFRLAPDQYAFVRQVQSACDSAKLGASLLVGREAPVHPDTEQTLDELHVRVRAVIGYLDGFSPDDFADAATRIFSRPHWEGKVMSGADYFREGIMPNFYFHLTHAYAILRHIGVPLGKRDYLGALSLRAP
jgi:hypothetical protein